jgi:hypothetical protein
MAVIGFSSGIWQEPLASIFDHHRTANRTKAKYGNKFVMDRLNGKSFVREKQAY